MANTTALWSRRLLIYQSGVQPLNKADQSRVANESLFPVRKVTAVAAAMMTFGGEALPPPPVNPFVGKTSYPDSVVHRKFSAAQQQYATFSRPIAVATPGWEGAQLECRFAKPLPVAQQQYAAFQPRGTINSTTPQGWWPLYPDLFAKPFPSPSQQFATFSRPIAIATPGWEGAQLDYRVQAKPFPVGSQQYTGFLLGFPPAPQGWAGYQLTYQFKASYPVAAQQFLALLQPRTADPSNTTTWRQQPLNPEPIKSLYPPALQQYEARGLPIIVPPTPDTTNLPGHGDWPRHVKKQKVRPVWDRRPDPISEGSPKTAAPAAAPIEAKAPAPQARNDGEGSPYLSRVLVPAEPPVVAQEKPAQKAKPLPRRKASVLADDVDSAAAYGTATVTARAEFSDDEDASSGSVTATHQAFVLGIDWDESITRRARARIEVEEESDTLSAEASWNDDDIALGLLLGDL